MRKFTHDEFLEKLYSIHKDSYIAISEYTGRKDNMTFVHRNCMNEVITTPNNLLMGRGCSVCAKNQRLTTSTFSEKLNSKYNGEYELVSEYENSSTHVTVRHVNCGNEYKVIPNNIIRGRRCPFCAQRGVTERKIFRELQRLYGNKVDRQVYFKELTSDKGVYLRYDIELKLSNRKIMIEYNGEQHYKPMRYRNAQSKFKLTQKHDRMKKEYALEAGYEFIEIKYNEDWKEVLRGYGLIG